MASTRLPLAALNPPSDTSTAGLRLVASRSVHGMHQKSGNVSVPAGEFDAVPIACKDRWNNMAYGTSDVAVFTTWYSPDIKNAVKRDVVTWFQGNKCADQETVLLKYTSPSN